MRTVDVIHNERTRDDITPPTIRRLNWQNCCPAMRPVAKLLWPLDISVDSIDAEPEEDEENEPLIDSDDEGDDDENNPDSDD